MTGNGQARVRVTILGCGSSGGVPRVGGAWGVCDPSEPRNRRTRCSLLVEAYQGTYSHETSTVVLIDTSPDLRAQLLAAKVTHIDAVLYTHDHADQSHGIDDVRAIVYHQRHRIPAYMDEVTSHSLINRFGYIFETPIGSHYPALLDAQIMPEPGEVLQINGAGGWIGFRVLNQNHGEMNSLGFRFGPVAYCNDCKLLPEASLAACYGLDLFIVDALRYAPHPSHAHLDQSLAWINTLKPKQAVLTNMHLDLDYKTLCETLPEGVIPAYDGLYFDLNLDQ
ncbi:MBL fold metallo-hydrolase [Candidatus Phycosocius spiralis]|uniref:Phosphoribosyl 1,2-cyclic phosphodiesterase n=1 Tax=Candidatus Phycosocius spiralis TaxID=2815099 RepID=A0ABQ4PSH6_9PROT|nr:MBL fold metallo-hydrolase [Candidatus Phycosocius spiralis]GIU65957.1 phosphoribosyl 1,2-cyclic phosphodiesterase [Candidatus Phycosocius spiralis]